MFHIKDESILCYLLTLLVYSKIETQIINWKSKKYLWKKGKKKNEGRGKDFSEVLTNSGSHSIFPEVTTDKYSKLDVKERERERRWRKYPCYNEDGEILWLETWRKRERASREWILYRVQLKAMLFSCERQSHYAFDFFFLLRNFDPRKS